MLAACSSEDANPADTDTGPVQEISYEVFPFVLSLDEPARDALRESRDDGTLVFDGAPAALADAQRGSIVLSGVAENAPHGLLRIVRGVERTSGSLVLHTVGAPPQLAFRRLHLRASDRISSFTDPANDWQYPSLGPTIKGSGKGKEPIDFFLFNGDGDPSTTDDQVRVHGGLGGGLEYDVDIDTDWGELDALSKIDDCVGKLLTFGLDGMTTHVPAKVFPSDVVVATHGHPSVQTVAVEVRAPGLASPREPRIQVHVVGLHASDARIACEGAAVREPHRVQDRPWTRCPGEACASFGAS